jgi:hypothetical protein
MTAKTYDVVVLSFRDTASEPAARAIARVIDVTEEEGEALLRNAPRAVRSRVDYATAEATAASLGLAGAEVAIAEHPFDAQRRTASGEIEGLVVRSTEPGHVPDPSVPVRRDVPAAVVEEPVDAGARTLLHVPAAPDVIDVHGVEVLPAGVIDATPGTTAQAAHLPSTAARVPGAERRAAPPPESARPRAEPAAPFAAPPGSGTEGARSRSSFPGRPSLGGERDSKMMGVLKRGAGSPQQLFRYVGIALLVAAGYVAWLFLLDHL